MNFMFSWQEQYLTRSLGSLVRYCSCHSNIKFTSSHHHVISSISSVYLTSSYEEVNMIAFKFLVELAERRTQIIDRDESLPCFPLILILSSCFFASYFAI